MKTENKVKLTKEKWFLVFTINSLLLAFFWYLFQNAGVNIFKTTISEIGLWNIMPLYILSGISNSIIFYSRLGENK